MNTDSNATISYSDSDGEPYFFTDLDTESEGDNHQVCYLYIEYLNILTIHQSVIQIFIYLYIFG